MAYINNVYNENTGEYRNVQAEDTGFARAVLIAGGYTHAEVSSALAGATLHVIDLNTGERERANIPLHQQAQSFRRRQARKIA